MLISLTLCYLPTATPIHFTTTQRPHPVSLRFAIRLDTKKEIEREFFPRRFPGFFFGWPLLIFWPSSEQFHVNGIWTSARREPWLFAKCFVHSRRKAFARLTRDPPRTVVRLVTTSIRKMCWSLTYRHLSQNTSVNRYAPPPFPHGVAVNRDGVIHCFGVEFAVL